MTDTITSQGSGPGTPPEQSSWWKTTVDFEPSFKFWFALMWQNWYILTFVIGVLLVIAWAFGWYDANWYVGLVGGLITVATGVGGFYMTYQDQKPNE